MKRNFLTIALLALGLPTFIACSDDDNSEETLIEATELPAKAQDFITSYFPEADYSRVEMNTTAESDGSLYEVELTGNIELDFNADGDWVDLDANGQQLPADLIPEKIADFIAANYDGLFITGIDTEPTGYEVELSTDLDLKFDKEGNFLSEDK